MNDFSTGTLAASAGLASHDGYGGTTAHRGTIVATTSDSLTAYTANGDVTASLNASTAFVSVVPPTSITWGPAAMLARRARVSAAS